jgi:hypothetical protein
MRHHILKFTLLFIVFIFVTLSCKEECCKDFKSYGIAFKLPLDWKIGEIDSTDLNFFFMTIGKEGHGASADAFIEWNKGSFSLDTVMNITQQGYLNEQVFQDGGIVFSQVKEEKYGKYKALVATFEVTLLDVKNSGKIHCFYLPECDKTVMIAYQQVADDAEKQLKDYKLIEDSFGCKK